MREKKNFAIRTNALENAEIKKKYFLVYEGEETEQIYFDAVNANKGRLKINPLIELVPIIRSYSEQGWSNPKKILDRVLLNLKEDKYNQVSYETLLNWIMEYLLDTLNISSRNAMAKSYWSILQDICSNDLCVQLLNIVPDVNSTCQDILQKFIQKGEIECNLDNAAKIIRKHAISYEEGFDKICFIIDRDRNSFVSHPDNDQYSYVLEQCKKNGFGFYLTNPCFEFWLLLHFDQVMTIDKNKLLENKKGAGKRSFTENELRKLIPGYDKSKYNAYDLLNRIDVAIKNEKNFCENEEELERTLGSRVGLLIEEMRN